MTSRELQTASFEETRGTLDPDRSYIILERAAVSEKDRDFETITHIISGFEDAIVDKHFFYDAGRACISLVITVDPARLESVVEEFLTGGLPKDITFYVYAHREVE